MNQAYCGKNCDTCIKREEIHCPGCGNAGHPQDSDCAIADCCRTKGHAACNTCQMSVYCPTLQSKRDYPRIILDKRAAESAADEEFYRNAPILAKWVWILFLLILPEIAAGLFGGDILSTAVPVLGMVGKALQFLTGAAYGAILLRLSAIEGRFRPAGWCCLIGAFYSAVSPFVNAAVPSLDSVLGIASSICVLVGEYNEFTGYAAEVHGVDPFLAESWERLWKWNIGLIIGMLAALVLVLFTPGLAALLLIAALIGTIAVKIMKSVYLYRTASLYRLQSKTDD